MTPEQASVLAAAIEWHRTREKTGMLVAYTKASNALYAAVTRMQSSPEVAAKPVAWKVEQHDGQHYFTDRVLPRSNYPDAGWTFTPLYTHPLVVPERARDYEAAVRDAAPTLKSTPELLAAFRDGVQPGIIKVVPDLPPREPTCAMLQPTIIHALCGQELSGCVMGEVWRKMYDAATTGGARQSSEQNDYVSGPESQTGVSIDGGNMG